MPPLPETILLVLTPFAPLFSRRVWLHAQTLLVGALLAPGTRTVTAALRAVGLAAERHFTKLPSGLEPSCMVGPPGQSDAVGFAPRGVGATRGYDRAGGRRHGGTPQRAPDQGQRLLPRCGPLDEEACHPHIAEFNILSNRKTQGNRYKSYLAF